MIGLSLGGWRLSPQNGVLSPQKKGLCPDAGGWSPKRGFRALVWVG